MKKSELTAVFIGMLIAATTTVNGAFIFAGILIGGAFTSAIQRMMHEGSEQVDAQLREFNKEKEQ